MNKDVVKYGMDSQLQVSPEQLDLIKKTVAVGATDDELKLFCYECQRRGVHPLDRKIFFVKRKDGDAGDKKATFQCSIDYFRSLAESEGEYDGQDDAEFGPETSQGYPEWARVNVYKRGVLRPIPGTARWKEYYPGEKQGFMWRKMPYHMLAKCAEVLALRKAFPQKLGGLYTDDEMAQAGAGNIVDVTPISETVKSIDGTGSPTTAAKTAAESSSKGLTPQEQLRKELAEYCEDETIIPALLKQISVFGDKGKEKWIKDIDKASDKWCMNALKKLQEIKKNKDAGNHPKGCTKDPANCENSGFVDGVAHCSDGQVCEFGKGKEYK